MFKVHHFIGRELSSKEDFRQRFNLEKKYLPAADALQKRLDNVLSPRVIFHFESLYNGLIAEFNEIADALNANKSDRSQFVNFLTAALDIKRQRAIKNIELLTISPLIAEIKRNGLDEVLPDDSGAEEKKPVKPADKREWIKDDWKKNKDKYDDQDKWAIAAAEKFKAQFKTPFGSPSSMKRYAHYDGWN